MENYCDSWPKNQNQNIAPIVICRQPQGHLISFIISDGWGSQCVELRCVKIQNSDGSISEVLIKDKWFFNSDSFPETISFVLHSLERPSFILIENGVGNLGIKDITVNYDNEQVWNGELPKGTKDKSSFPIAVPMKINEFQKPDIHTLRNTTIHFSLDLDIDDI